MNSIINLAAIDRMKIEKLIITAFAVLALCSSCGGDVELGEETPLAPPYTLPERGESEAGDRIIDFFEKYTTFLLYDFTQADFQWETVSSGLKYEAVYGDPQYLGDMIDFLDEVWLDFYSDKFKQEKFPFKIYLTDSIAQRPRWEGQPTTYHKALARDNAVAVAGMNKDLKTMSAEDKRIYKDEVNRNFITFLLNSNKLEVPAEFYAVSDYTKFATWSETRNNPDILRTYGYLPNLDNEHIYNMASDWATSSWAMQNAGSSDLKAYLQNMMMHGKDFPTLNDGRYTWDYYLQKNEDGTYKFPLIKQKYDILQKYFKDEFDMDLAAIGQKTY